MHLKTERAIPFTSQISTIDSPLNFYINIFLSLLNTFTMQYRYPRLKAVQNTQVSQAVKSQCNQCLSFNIRYCPQEQ